jgi:hypothetical protein
MKTQFSRKHPLSFLFLSFYSKEKENKFQHEYTQKSLNTIRLGLVLICLIVLFIDIYYNYKKKNSPGWAIIDSILFFYAILVIVWSYYDFLYFSQVLQPGIGLGVFAYMIAHLFIHAKNPEPPTFYMLSFVSLFMLKIAFRFIVLYSFLFLIFYQIAYIFVIQNSIQLLADDVLLISTIVSILSASYVYEYYVRKTFLKKETFLAERKRLVEEKKKNRNILRNILPLAVADKWNYSNIATIPEKGN